MEIIVGIVLLFIALVFSALIILLFTKATWEYNSILVAAVLAFCAFGFGKLGYRLVFNKPRNNGGLLSNNGLKLGCIFFGVSSIIWCILSITKQDLGSGVSAISMLVACLYGWKIAKNRPS